jgi:L-asparaginase II
VKVLVCGSRDFAFDAPIRRELMKLPPGTIILHGGARGADMIAGLIAKELGFEVRCYPVSSQMWAKFGRAAGVLRNSLMLKKEHPDANGVPIDKALAFTRDLDKSRGTKDMVGKLRKADIGVEVFAE